MAKGGGRSNSRSNSSTRYPANKPSKTGNPSGVNRK